MWTDGHGKRSGGPQREGVGVILRRVERVKSMVMRDLNSEEHNAIHR